MAPALLVRRADGPHLVAARVELGGEPLDAAALSGRVPALEDEDGAVAALEHADLQSEDLALPPLQLLLVGLVAPHPDGEVHLVERRGCPAGRPRTRTPRRPSASGGAWPWRAPWGWLLATPLSAAVPVAGPACRGRRESASSMPRPLPRSPLALGSPAPARRQPAVAPRRAAAARGLAAPTTPASPTPGTPLAGEGPLDLGPRGGQRRRADLQPARPARRRCGPPLVRPPAGSKQRARGPLGALARRAGHHQPDRVPRGGGGACPAGRGVAPGGHALESTGLVQAAHDGRRPGGVHRAGGLPPARSGPARRRSPGWTRRGSPWWVTTSAG